MIAAATDDDVAPNYRSYAEDIGQAGNHLLKLIDGMACLTGRAWNGASLA